MKYINIILIFIAVFAMMGNTQALEQNYAPGESELAMKDFVAEYGGSFVYIQPHDARGVRDFSISPHWLNRVGVGNGTYYIDYMSRTEFSNVTEISTWYRVSTGRRNIVYDFADRRPHYGIRWNYPIRSGDFVYPNERVSLVSELT